MENDRLLTQAKTAILMHMDNPQYNEHREIDYSHESRGLFIRLTKDGKERGCRGFYRGVSDLYSTCETAAINAAFFDDRFPPLQGRELSSLSIELIMVGPFQQMKGLDDFDIHTHSLLYNDGTFRSFLQAQDGTAGSMTREEFLDILARKAGLNSRITVDHTSYLFKAKTKLYKKKFNEIKIGR